MKNFFFRETVSDGPSLGMTASLLIHRFHLQRSGMLSDCDQACSLLVSRKLQFHTAIRAPMQMIDGTGAVMPGLRASASHRTHVNKVRRSPRPPSDHIIDPIISNVYLVTGRVSGISKTMG
ncbi:hypothetical protein M404DRAFT_991216 [Pisolithus tinctorius Marx 270]|uniref:Uncharacterized protein n=1 Tax=Pisolithus tinctorius Marx 270 TaxID=870435 RepID=A0A0C3PYV6_PISTI|nr:hypothetical protein M404DRAFT_991216 [Pisolithus tinctorius Marx 270]